MKGLAVLVAIALICATALSRAGERAIEPAPPPAPQSLDAAQITLGSRLAAVGDCIVCHSAPDSAPFAGGRALNTPFGTIYSTNITPDTETGIGSWTLAAFSRAMRNGVSRDGHLLYPAFPYVHYTRMSDADIAAVYAYLMSRDPVRATAPSNKLIFPLNFRPLIAGWNLLYLHPGPEALDSPDSPAGPIGAANAAAQNTPNATNIHDPQWQRGRYLVDGLGHCAACHTPLNLLGAEKRKAALQGGTIDGWDAPPLTALLQAPTPWTREQLVDYLRSGLASEHGAAAGPMRPVTETLAGATNEDVEAIAVYLLSLQTPARVQLSALPVQAASQAEDRRAARPSQTQAATLPGATLFAAACASCHSASAPMSTNGERPSLAQGTAVNADSPRNALRMILDGIGWQGSTSAHFMPPYAQLFTDAQIADLANYTRARFSTREPWPSLDAAAVARIRKESRQP
ncbi:cytochrome c [Paraburkholderia fungorum]|uniref:c-type cytochrome n=1 Tax=Paraburkholderia fungorum TaxID=134537 RepID=UPI0038B8AD7F